MKFLNQIKKLYLYGSQAKKKTTKESDIDLLIIYNKELINYERCLNEEKLITFLSNKMKTKVDIIDFTHAIEKLDIVEMENIITLI